MNLVYLSARTVSQRVDVADLGINGSEMTHADGSFRWLACMQSGTAYAAKSTSPASRMLKWSGRPMITWSSTSMPMIRPAATI